MAAHMLENIEKNREYFHNQDGSTNIVIDSKSYPLAENLLEENQH